MERLMYARGKDDGLRPFKKDRDRCPIRWCLPPYTEVYREMRIA